MKILPVMLGLLLAGSVGSIQAQTPGAPAGAQQPPALPPGEVTGTIVADDNAAPVARAAIAVRNKADSAMVTGTNGADDGTFKVQGLRPGTYYLRVSGIGFTPKNSEEFTIAPAAPVASVNVKLARFAVSLQTVEVEGQAPAVVIEPDRNSYNAKDVAPAAANASDVLDSTPSVEVDGDGKVSLRGNENVVVQINGRPTPMRGPQLAAYLKSSPRTIVERIEVVPNPSAKYDPEGMAGIINIVLKQNTDLGRSGGITLGMANADRYNASGNLGYQSGPVTFFGSYGFITDDRGIIGINDRERYDPRVRRFRSPSRTSTAATEADRTSRRPSTTSSTSATCCRTISR